MKKGMTLVETTVAMALFVTVFSIAIGAYVTVSRTKTLASNMRESQQKVRTAMEVISRLARQSEQVNVSADKKEVILYFNFVDSDNSNQSAQRFLITGNTLKGYECQTYPLASKNCTSWTAERNLFGGAFTLDPTESYFEKIGMVPPTLNIKILGSIPGVDGTPEHFDLITAIVLENIK